MSLFFWKKNKNENSQRQPLSRGDSPVSATGDDERTRKKVFGWLAVFIVLVLGFSIWQTGRALKSPFQKKSTNSSSTASANLQTATNQITETTLESLRSKDTDQDGVTDYDELYVYHTSPYLTDSDSDAATDKEEIASGADPNCPAGQTCSREATNVNAAASNANASADLTNGLLTGQDLTADQLREILRDSGVSESELNQLDDATLMSLYQEALAEEEGAATDTNAAASQNTNAADETVTYDDLKNLSIEEIRYLLEQSGVPQESLDQVDDATLQQIYLDSLEQNSEQMEATNTNS